MLKNVKMSQPSELTKVAEGGAPTTHEPGVVEIGHLSGEALLPAHVVRALNPSLKVPSQGVCDAFEEVIEAANLRGKKRAFIVFFTPIIEGSLSQADLGEWGPHVKEKEPPAFGEGEESTTPADNTASYAYKIVELES